MKKILTLLSGIILCFSLILFAGEKKTGSKEKETPKGAKVNVEKVFGEITNIDTNSNTIAIKQLDGSVIILKATTPEIQDAIKNFKVGDKVKALYIPKEGELILFKIKSIQEKEKLQTKEKKTKTE